MFRPLPPALISMILAACSGRADPPERTGPPGGGAPGSNAPGSGAVHPYQGHDDRAAPAAATGPQISKDPEHVAGESCLGVEDDGIWSDLDAQVQLGLPAGLTAARAEGVIAADGGVLVLYVDGWPTKPYPLGDGRTVTIGEHALVLRDGDAAELAGLLDAGNLRRLAGATAGDRDGDDLPDPLDVLVGAKKTVVDAGTYGAGYLSLSYPGGDVPRGKGVCTDVVIRALRNAGLDLQAEVHRDIKRSRRSYPMVKGSGDTNIDHRRVKTILPYFKRHIAAHTARLDDPDDPLRPGDIIFMDTFPSRSGPDHIGIVSDVLGEDGLPLVINSWTDGYVTSEMDLLGWVPVTHRFRL